MHTNVAGPGLSWRCSDWRQQIPKAVEEAANAFKKAAKRLKMAKGDVKSYLDVDQAAGLRPDFRIVLDNGSIPIGSAQT